MRFANLIYGTSAMCLEGDPGAGTGGAGTGATAGGAGAGAAGSGAGAGSGTSAGIPWLPGAQPEEIAFAQSKGWHENANAPADQIFRSYHNLQKLFGADKAGNTVVLPGETADEATVNSFYNRLGRPEAPEKYTAGDFSGMPPEVSKELKGVAHKLGLTEKQMKGLHEWNEGVTKTLSEKHTQDAMIEQAAQESKLKTEWGAAFDQNIQLAKEAAAKMGWTDAQIQAMQVGIGYDGVLKLAHQIGKAVGEGTFVGGDGAGAGRGGGKDNVMSPEQAASELKKLGNDPEFNKAWMDKLHPKHAEMVQKKSQLSAWAVGAK